MNFGGFNSEDWSSFIYLALLLIYLSSSIIFRSHLKTSQLVKQFMAWTGFALVVLILYSFRYEFKSIKNRVLVELFPTNAVQISTNQISIAIADDGHFHMDANVNNLPIRFLIDTGASSVILSLNDAKRIGIDTNRLNYNRVYNTANGKVMGAVINLAKIEIGGMVFKDVAATVNNSDMDVSLLGMSFLNRFQKYEFFQDKLILTY